MPVHDAVAVAHVIDPTLLEMNDCGVVVDTGPELSRGRTTWTSGAAPAGSRASHVAVAIDAERFLELLVERIALLGQAA